MSKNLQKSEVLAHYKRLIELCYSNKQNRDDFFAHPESFLKQNKLELDALTAKQAIEVQFKTSNEDKELLKENLYIQMFSEAIQHVRNSVDYKSNINNVKNEKLAMWIKRRRNQIAVESSLIKKETRGLSFPIAFELSKGCSGNCSFCCFDSKNLQGVFEYNQENEALWKNILTASKDSLGEISATGICYHSTEPLDNEDYDKFITDYNDILGEFPHTTTVLPLKDIAQTKSLIKVLGKDINKGKLRFSIVSLKQLEEVHKAFSPTDLYCIELVLNNRESIYKYSLSGRAFKLAKSIPKGKVQEGVGCGCITGFIVNLLDKTIDLVTPCTPSENNPIGYKIYEQVSFTDANSYKEKLEFLIDKYMPLELDENTKIRLNSYMKVSRENFYTTFYGSGFTRTISTADYVYEAIKLIQKDLFSLIEIYIKLNLNYSQQVKLKENMQLLFSLGYLED